MKKSVENALGGLPPGRRASINWLSTTSKVYEIVVRASNPRMEKDTAVLEELNSEFFSIRSEDPLFNHFSVCCGDLFFDRLAGWASNGFRQGYF